MSDASSANSGNTSEQNIDCTASFSMSEDPLYLMGESSSPKPTNYMAWFSLSENGNKILYLNKAGQGWKPYTHSDFARVIALDYKIAGGSKGFATFQKLLKCGWVAVNEEVVKASLKNSIERIDM